VLVARNEGSRIGARLQNLAQSDYAADRLEYLIISDGSTDETVEVVTALDDPRVRLLQHSEQRGKAVGVNAGVAAARGEIIVFADARQTFDPSTIRELSRELLAPGLGAVSGELDIAGSHGGTGAALDVYWKMERRLRKAEAEVDSCIGCTGAVYAIWRNLFTPIPTDTILDDVVIPMQIALRGKRVAFSPRARAFDSQPLDPAMESQRKRRTLAGNFQMLFRYPGWLLPWRNRLWWQLIAHKYLRLLMPILLITLAAANGALLSIPFYRATGVIQVAFYALAAGAAVSRARVCTIPAGFVFLNYNVLRGFGEYLTGRSGRGWSGGRSH
jgi:cellulose synthase/poly-beta-1,6-N-acetylglucosamine synthase-like glycosyltransferase